MSAPPSPCPAPVPSSYRRQRPAALTRAVALVGPLVALAALTTPGAAEADGDGDDPAARRSVYQVWLPADVPIITAGVLGILIPYHYSAKIIDKRCPCDPREVNGFDRGAIDNRSDTAALVSDVGVALALAAPLVVDAVGVRAARTWFEDLTVYSEVLAINGALVTIVKHLANRPLPRTYAGDPAEIGHTGGYRSFYSGHTVLAVAGLTTATMTAGLRHGQWLWPTVASVGLGGGVAALRVASGYHFWTDVLVGAGVSGALAVAIPLLHRRSGRDRLALVPLAPPPLGDGVGGSAAGLALAGRL